MNKSTWQKWLGPVAITMLSSAILFVNSQNPEFDWGYHAISDLGDMTYGYVFNAALAVAAILTYIYWRYLQQSLDLTSFRYFRTLNLVTSFCFAAIGIITKGTYRALHWVLAMVFFVGTGMLAWVIAAEVARLATYRLQGRIMQLMIGLAALLFVPLAFIMSMAIAELVAMIAMAVCMMVINSVLALEARQKSQ